MRRILVSLALAALLFAMSVSTTGVSVAGKQAVSDDTEENVRQNEEPVTWTMMVYVAGDNNLEFQAVYDLIEMESVGSQNGVNIIALVDTETLFEGTHWYYVGMDEEHFDLAKEETYCDCEEILGPDGCHHEELNMGDPDTLQMFIEVSVAFAPADRYMLVLWDHGGGWYGVCWDDSSIREEDGRTDRLTVHETAEAIAAAEETTGIYLDIIGFDACLMSMIEVAYEFRDLADYMISSVTGIPFDGWAYDLFLDDLVANPSMSVPELLDHIIDGYVEYYSFCTGKGLGGWTGVSLTSIDLSTIEDLAAAVDSLSYDLMAGLASGEISRGDVTYAFAANTPALQMFGEQYAFPDLSLGVECLGSMYDSLSEDADTIVSIVEESVVCDWVSQVSGGAFTTTGLTIYLPYAYYYTYVDYSYETEEEAAAAGELIYYGLDFATDTNWDEFVLDFCQAYVAVE